ncbi:MAG TPA: PEP-CTERM sorting domain-containing protein [Candidatus Aquilonibacter sp.]|nr:PEP-CTERM sorting domain-containing protein [Candidatus Aquilonibacter sp.]
MRKLLSVFLLLLVGVALAPAAHADTYTDASFTCTSSCVDVPVDPPVIFPSPNIPISFFGQTFSITLNQLDQDTDIFTWSVGTNGSSWYFLIDDITKGLFDIGPSYTIGNSGTPYGGGGVYFTTTPEPGSGMLLLLGAGIMFLAWKFRGNGRPQLT